MSAGFLGSAPPTSEAQGLFDDDLVEVGHIMNVTRLWAHRPRTCTGLFDLMSDIVSSQRLDARLRGILVTACASTLGDSYCSLSWGTKLAAAADAETAAGVLRGDDAGLTGTERAMAGWARKVVRDPSGTTAADVQELRDAGLDDDRIFAITVFVALRIAFSTVNGALGVPPDAAFRTRAPQAVLDAVGYGRPIAESPPH